MSGSIHYRGVKINPPLRGRNLRILGGGFILYKIQEKKFRASRGRFYSLQIPENFPRVRAGGFILYKILKIFRALRAGGFVFYKICCQNRPIFERFLDRFRPNNSQNP